jgi:hypothetical protein
LTVQYADSPESLQQLLLGAYPQLQGQGGDPVDTTEEEAPAEVSEPESEDQSAAGATEQRNRSIAARKRSLQLLVLTTGGITDET